MVLKNVVSKELTAAAKAHMAADVAGEFGANATGRTCAIRVSAPALLQPRLETVPCSDGAHLRFPTTAHGRSPPPAENPIGSEPAILNLINASKFRPVLQSLIGDFDEPTATQVAVTPPGTDYISGKEDGAEGFNGCGYREEGFPYYNAIVHMDGLTGGVTPKRFVPEEEMSDQEIYWRYVGKQGRNADNIGSNGGVLFQDKECTLSTGSFTLFAVLCLNDQTEPGRGQFTVLRGSHHAMEQFVRALSSKPLPR